MYFRPNKKGNCLAVGICSKFPRHFMGGTPQKKRKLLPNYLKKAPTTQYWYMWDLQPSYFFLHEQKIRSLQYLGLNWISFKHPAIVSFCVWKNPGPHHLSGDKKEKSLWLLQASPLLKGISIITACSWALPSWTSPFLLRPDLSATFECVHQQDQFTLVNK